MSMRTPALLAALLLAGCSSQSEPASTPSVDAAACGFAVGQKICDLPLVGHVRDAITGSATAAPERAFTFHDVFAAGTQKYVFVHTSAFW